MAVTWIQILGTAEQIKDIKAALPMTKADRIRWEQKIFPHMCKRLGIDIYEVSISKQRLTPAFITALEQAIERNPKSIWYGQTRGDDPRKGCSDFQRKPLTNFYHTDNTPDHPGPFGALCLRYGVPFK